MINGAYCIGRHEHPSSDSQQQHKSQAVRWNGQMPGLASQTTRSRLGRELFSAIVTCGFHMHVHSQSHLAYLYTYVHTAHAHTYYFFKNKTLDSCFNGKIVDMLYSRSLQFMILRHLCNFLYKVMGLENIFILLCYFIYIVSIICFLKCILTV